MAPLPAWQLYEGGGAKCEQSGERVLRHGMGLSESAAQPPSASGHVGGPSDAVGPGDAVSADQGSPHRRLLFTLVAVALLMTSIDQNIVATVLTVFHTELHAPINWASWTITIYSLGRVLVLPLAGSLSDQYGRRTVFLVSIGIFTASSLACGLADNIYVLVALRGVQAIGGAGFMPSAVGVVVDTYGPGRDRAVGLFASLVPIGAIIGPVVGSLLVAAWNWRAIFFINVPIGIVLLILGAKHMPADRPRSEHRPLDVRGMGLLGGGMLAAMFSITYLGSAGGSVANVTFIVPVTVAVISLYAFVRHTNRCPSPLIPPRLLHGPGFRVMNLLNLVYGSAALGFTGLVPIYATERYGIHILGSGTLLGARAIGMSSVAFVASAMLRRTGYRMPMLVGFLITAAGMLAMAASPIGMSPYAWLATSSAVVGIGNGLISPASNNAGLQLAPEHAAAIASLRATFRQIGSIAAVSGTTAVLARSQNPGLSQAWVFAVFAVIVLCMLPLLTVVPEHRGGW